jgi:hypothetical protein
MNRNLKGKSYNEVMNEWAAQKHFLKRAASGLMRPAGEVTGGARIRGWIWRVVLFITIPSLFYMGFLRIHGKSGEFTTQIAAETKKFLDAEKVDFRRIRWDLNGEFRVERIEATGKPQNIFTKLEVSNLTTVIPIPRVFRSAWELDQVHATKVIMELRSGSMGKPVANNTVPALLIGGYGLSPDFSKLTIGSYHTDALTLSWGNTPSTAGAIKASKAGFTRADGGWNLALAGGTFRQGWLDGLRVNRAAAHISADRVDISEGDFTVAGGGSGSFTGGFTLGDQPEVNATVKLENIPLHQFTSEYFAGFVKATGNGTVKISGSPIRTNGLLLDATFKIQSGKLTAIPLLRALEMATGESGISAPDITGGDAHIVSHGTQDAGGLLVEADTISLDCGTRLKLGISVRHERKQVLITDLDAAKQSSGDTVALSTKGTIRIGLPPATAGRLKASIRQQFITREEHGLQWMDIPFSLDKGEFTREAADKITALHFAQD